MALVHMTGWHFCLFVVLGGLGTLMPILGNICFCVFFVWEAGIDPKTSHTAWAPLTSQLAPLLAVKGKASCFIATACRFCSNAAAVAFSARMLHGTNSIT